MNDRHPTDVETATAGTRTEALRSLARQAGVPLDQAIAAADRGELRSLVTLANTPRRRKITAMRQQLETRRLPRLGA